MYVLILAPQIRAVRGGSAQEADDPGGGLAWEAGSAGYHRTSGQARGAGVMQCLGVDHKLVSCDNSPM